MPFGTFLRKLEPLWFVLAWIILLGWFMPWMVNLGTLPATLSLLVALLLMLFTAWRALNAAFPAHKDP